MPTITTITTHVADAKARLLNQFKAKPLIEGMLDAIDQQVQDLEDALIPLQALLDISTMEGVQLDAIGTILGQAREGLSDTDYRTALLLRIQSVYSSGTPEDVIAAYVQATGSTSVSYKDDFPAGYDISGDGVEPADILAIMEAASPAGVEVGLWDNLIWENGENAITEGGDNLIVTPFSS